jgi:16S rRNA (adenine1518-N6/adenine1519-N6)-dimethyltransferase
LRNSAVPEPAPFPPLGVLLRRFDIHPDKRRSQHFLRHPERCTEIAELCNLTPQHTVVEIGAGPANLTHALARHGAEVIAVEPDRVFAPWYEELVAAQPNLRFLREDFLKLDLAELLASAREAGRPICAAGNLPYQITSAILFHLVDAVFPFESLVLMMQREVADRIAAGAGERACGGLSCKVALRYHARIAMRLAPGEFMPPPAVHSAVLVLTPLAQPLYRDEAHRGRLYKLIDGVFRYRRKTVENGLIESQISPDRASAAAALRRADVDAKLRPEALSLDQFLAIESALE